MGDVFGFDAPEEKAPPVLQLVPPEPPPLYKDFEPLYSKLINLRAIKKTAAQYLASFGALIKESRGDKDPVIEGLTWQHIDQMKELIAEKETKLAEKKQGKEPQPKSDAKPGAKAKDETWFAKEFEKLVKVAEKKGYDRASLLHEAGSSTNTAFPPEQRAESLAKFLAEQPDISPQALERAAKEKEARAKLEFAQSIRDRQAEMKAASIVNPETGVVYSYQDLIVRYCANMALQEKRKEGYEAEKRELEAEENSLNTLYWRQICALNREEFEKRRRKNPGGPDTFYPATIKLGWVNVKRTPVKGGPECTDKEMFQDFADTLIDQGVLEEFMSRLTPEHQKLFANCFSMGIVIDWRACEIAVSKGVPFPNWIIKQPDDIGETKFYFAKPRDKKTGKAEEETDDDV